MFEYCTKWDTLKCDSTTHINLHFKLIRIGDVIEFKRIAKEEACNYGNSCNECAECEIIEKAWKKLEGGKDG